MTRARAVALLAAAVFVWVALPHVTLSTDARYSLAWGAEIARGQSPDLSGSDLPTPHPLPIAIGVALEPLGAERAAHVYEALAALAYALLLCAVFGLARASAGTVAGAAAAALVLTRAQVSFFGAHGFVDIPFAALVLLAAAAVGRDARRNWPAVLAFLALAGLLRPEAWGLAVLYALWLALRGGGLPLRAAALAVAAPVIWLGFDLVVTGDALHSLAGTREGAQALARPTGVGNLAAVLRDGVRQLLGWPLALAGLALGTWALATRTRVAGLLVATALVACGGAWFSLFALAGLPLNARYLLVPALALLVLAAASVALARRSALALAVAVLTFVGAAASLPGQIGETRDVLALAKEKHRADADLPRLLARGDVRRAIARCPLAGASGSARASVAALTRRDPRHVAIARDVVPRPGTSTVATSDSLRAGTPAITLGAWSYIAACPRQRATP